MAASSWNLRIVSWGVNWLHGHHPIAAISFVRRILRATTNSDDIVQQKEELQLCFNALTNIGTISAITGNTSRHNLRHQRWVDLSSAEAEAVFETLRTADKSPYVNDFIALFSNQQLFRYRDFRDVHQFLPTPPSAMDHPYQSHDMALPAVEYLAKDGTQAPYPADSGV